MYEYGKGLSLSGGLGLNPDSAGLGLKLPNGDAFGSMLITSGGAGTSSFSPSLGNFGLGMQVVSAISGAMGSFYSAKSQISSLKFQADMAEINARIAESGAQSVLDQGQRQVGQLTLRAGQLKSSQRAAMAANGIDLGTGSAAEVQASTDIMKEIDKNTIEANAVRAAWGYRTQATNLVNESIMRRGTADSISPFSSATSSLLGSAGGAAASWYQLKKAGAFNSPSNG